MQINVTKKFGRMARLDDDPRVESARSRRRACFTFVGLGAAIVCVGFVIGFFFPNPVGARCVVRTQGLDRVSSART